MRWNNHKHVTTRRFKFIFDTRKSSAADSSAASPSIRRRAPARPVNLLKSAAI